MAHAQLAAAQQQQGPTAKPSNVPTAARPSLPIAWPSMAPAMANSSGKT
jgi:hypothetical protein